MTSMYRMGAKYLQGFGSQLKFHILCLAARIASLLPDKVNDDGDDGNNRDDGHVLVSYVFDLGAVDASYEIREFTRFLRHASGKLR